MLTSQAPKQERVCQASCQSQVHALAYARPDPLRTTFYTGTALTLCATRGDSRRCAPPLYMYNVLGPAQPGLLSINRVRCAYSYDAPTRVSLSIKLGVRDKAPDLLIRRLAI